MKNELLSLGFIDKGHFGERLPFEEQVKREQANVEITVDKAAKRSGSARR